MESTLVGAGLGAALGFTGTLRMRAPANTHGSAGFRRSGELRELLGSTGLVAWHNGAEERPPRTGGPAHLATVAPTRAGKGGSAILPNPLIVDRSAIMTDPKREKFHVSARVRSEPGPIYALGPCGITGTAASACNPMGGIEFGGDRFAEDAAELAEVVVADPAGDADAAHWNGEARALITGLILHCASPEDPAERLLGDWHRCLTLSPDGTQALFAAMQGSNAALALVPRAANRRFHQNEREAASFLSKAQRHRHFLDSPPVSASLS